MKQYTCSFCGKTHNDSAKMIVSKGLDIVNDVCVCSDCVTTMYTILNQEKNQEMYNTDVLKKPSEIKQWLDKYIISQEAAKKAVSAALYEHQKQLKYNSNLVQEKEALERINMLVVGASGKI